MAVEEIGRLRSIAIVGQGGTWKRIEVILANTPGYGAFLPDSFATMRAVDGVVFVVSAGADLKVESEKIFEEINKLGLPRIAFVSRLDRERMSFAAAMD